METRRGFFRLTVPVALIGFGVFVCGETFNPSDPNYKGFVILVDGMS